MALSILKTFICLILILLSCCGAEPPDDTATIGAVTKVAREAVKSLDRIAIKDYLCLASCDLLEASHIECEKCK